MEKFDGSMIGKRVAFTDAQAHKRNPGFYPPAGSIGTIVYDGNDKEWAVQWSEDSGVAKNGVCGDYAWYCWEEALELVEEKPHSSNEMTDEEIWKMLEPKMTKNGFTPYGVKPFCKYYDEKDVHDMVALAYRVGYMRAKKGKPFAYKRKENVKNEG